MILITVQDNGILYDDRYLLSISSSSIRFGIICCENSSYDYDYYYYICLSLLDHLFSI